MISPIVRHKVPVFVMLPLDSVDADAHTSKLGLADQLTALSVTAVTGVMVDVWWRLCEPHPGQYRFDGYLEIMQACRALGMKVQAVMSFHKCGGNIGDEVTIPLPDWVLELRDTVPELLYRPGDPAAEPSDDCVSLSCDGLAVFPGREPGGARRTALDCYEGFMRAFREAARAYIADGTLVEIQVGLGPCGELRYPSYQLGRGWAYPNIGAFQCGDAGMVRDMKEKGIVNPLEHHGELHQMNIKPSDTAFFGPESAGTEDDLVHYRSQQGARFLEWYGARLVQHGDVILARARGVFGPSMKLAGKVAGIHWLSRHHSRAAESAAGYTGGYLTSIAAMFKAHDAILDFTCLEMYDAHNDEEDHSTPERLVADVYTACKAAGITFAGENAKAMTSDIEGWDQIVRHYGEAILRTGADTAGFTLLRLTPELVDTAGNMFPQLCRFVCLMSNISEPILKQLREHSEDVCTECVARRAATNKKRKTLPGNSNEDQSGGGKRHQPE